MKVIRFRRLDHPPKVVDGVRIERWEIAFNEDDLWSKLNGDMAEIIMPEKSWFVRLWRKLFTPIAIEMRAE